MSTPDAIFPSDNEYGIPTLDLDLDAKYVDAPVRAWGVEARNARMRGTYHFYRDDYKFSSLWANPKPVVQSKCVAIIEPNFSTSESEPMASALYQIYRKRWLSRYWQTKGIRTVVDLHVADRWQDLNLLGVTKDWTTYATRGSDDTLEQVICEAHVGIRHAQGAKVSMVVIGGATKIKQLCYRKRWIWVPAPRQTGFKISEHFNATAKAV